MAGYKTVECSVCMRALDLHPTFPICNFCYWAYGKPKTLEETLEKLMKGSAKQPHDDPKHPVNRFMRYLEYEPVGFMSWEKAVCALRTIGFVYDHMIMTRPPGWYSKLKRPDYGEYA
jgi:hypothetical protein